VAAEAELRNRGAVRQRNRPQRTLDHSGVKNSKSGPRYDYGRQMLQSGQCRPLQEKWPDLADPENG
jgi:hypothetical protein